MSFIYFVILLVVLIGVFGFLWVQFKTSKNSLPLENIQALQLEIKELRDSNLDLCEKNAKLETELKHTLQELNIAKMESTEMKQTIVLKESNLQQTFQELLTTKQNQVRLKLENETLSRAYNQLELMLNNLKVEITKELGLLKDHALTQLKIESRDSLTKIGQESIVYPLEKGLKEVGQLINNLQKETELVNKNANNLSSEAHLLALALTRDSKKKGDFGELVLKNILESVGLNKYIDYQEQANINFNDKRLIPDCIINLPHNRAVVIDSKNLSGHYYNGLKSELNNNKAVINAVKTTLKELSSKEYQKALSQLNQNVEVFDYIIMFIPSQNLFDLLLEEDQKLAGELLKEAYQHKIFMAGPSTLLLFLTIIEKAWNSYMVEEKAAEVIKLAQELEGKFNTVLAKINELGTSLKKAGSSFDGLIGALANDRADCALGKLNSLVKLSGSKKELTSPALLGEVSTRFVNILE